MALQFLFVQYKNPADTGLCACGYLVPRDGHHSSLTPLLMDVLDAHIWTLKDTLNVFQRSKGML